MATERAVERRVVSVLFADLVGFTSLSEELDAEDVTLVQDAYFEAVRETWRPVIKGDFELGWRKSLHAGWIEDTKFDTSGKSAADQVCPRLPERNTRAANPPVTNHTLFAPWVTRQVPLAAKAPS